MTPLVSSPDKAFEAVRKLNAILPSHPSLADRLGQAHAFYVLEQVNAEPLFGFSKFVGYDGLSAETYLRNYKLLNGRNTEHALSKWFEELRYGSPAYNTMLAKLSVWLGRYGKTPREGKSQKVRLMVVKSEFREPDAQARPDRKLLDLLMAVVDLLPADQRHELRAAL